VVYFQIFSFQISKMISTFFIQFFVTYFNFFSFPFGVMAIVFKFQFKFQNRVFSKFSFPFGGRAKIFNSNFKNKKNHFKFSCGINEFFSRHEVVKFIKRLQKLFFTITKNSH
jgi:hypothetical protein